MTIIREKFNIPSNGFGEAFDITQKVSYFVNNHIHNSAVMYLTTNLSKCAFYVGNENDLKALNNLIAEFLENKNLNLEINAQYYDLISVFKTNFYKNNSILHIEDSKLILNSNERIFLLNFENSKNVVEILVSILI